jgi:hypothetical protein
MITIYHNGTTYEIPQELIYVPFADPTPPSSEEEAERYQMRDEPLA